MAPRALLAAALLLLTTSCASHALWLNGHPPILETYAQALVRIYRAGVECRIEIVTASETVITLPTRCLTVPHIARP
jgi:hypothetical protein